MLLFFQFFNSLVELKNLIFFASPKKKLKWRSCCNETNCNKLAKVWPWKKLRWCPYQQAASRLIGFSFFARSAKKHETLSSTRFVVKPEGDSNVCWLFLNICWGSTKTWRIERLGRSLKGNDRETIDFIEFIGKTLLVLRIPNGNTNIIPNRCVRLWDTVGINATQSH